MSKEKLRIEEILLLILVLVLPFTLSDTFYESENLQVYILPSSIVSIASIVRWIIICVMILTSMFLIYSRKIIITKLYLPIIFINIAYIILLIYAIMDVSDIPRYLSLVLMSAFIPIFITYINISNRLMLIMKLFISIVIIISIIPNINMLGVGRFSGFSGNSNLFGALSICLLSFLFLKTKSKYDFFYTIIIVLVVLLIVMTGSRNSVFAAIFLCVFSVKLTTKHIAALLLGIIVVVLSMSNNESFLRVFDTSTSVLSSGRGDIWNAALAYIKDEALLFGNGAIANKDIVGVANIHNVYLRLLLNVGLVFASLFVILYSLGISFFYKYRKLVPRSLIAFNIAFLIMNLGEDYLIGPGSMVLTYIFISQGVILSKIKHENITNQYRL